MKVNCMTARGSHWTSVFQEIQDTHAVLKDDVYAVAAWLLPSLRRAGVSVSVQAAQPSWQVREIDGLLSQLKPMADKPPDVWA